MLNFRGDQVQKQIYLFASRKQAPQAEYVRFACIRRLFCLKYLRNLKWGLFKS